MIPFMHLQNHKTLSYFTPFGRKKNFSEYNDMKSDFRKLIYFIILI